MKKKIKREKVPSHAHFTRPVKMIKIKGGYRFIDLKESKRA